MRRGGQRRERASPAPRARSRAAHRPRPRCATAPRRRPVRGSQVAQRAREACDGAPAGGD
eukprot:3461244-Prymnesium_polylepis.2